MRSVRLILLEDVPSLGEAGDLISVKVGYARNYLLPQGRAILATESKIKELEHNKRVVSEKLAKELKDLEALRDRLQALELEVVAKAGEEGKLFGSVTSAHVADLLAEKGFDIGRRKIALEEHIKEVGEHTVPVRLRKELVAEVRLKVSAEE
jgi:large subunit ribosomal protein L9